MWTVLALLDDLLQSELQFLVIPEEETKSGPLPASASVEDSSFSRYIQEDSERRLKEYDADEAKSGESRNEWIQSLLDM